MHIASHSFRRGVRWLWAAGFAIAASLAAAQADPPARVGRLADLQGGVSWYDHEQGRWADAERNRPLTGGDRISTAPRARAEVRVGSTVLRLAGNTELEVLRLDDERMEFQLHAGSAALRVRSREVASEIEVVTAEVRLHPQRAGHFRIDRVDDSTFASVWRGDLRIADADGFTVTAGQRVELYREGRSRQLRHAFGGAVDDDFGAWVARAEQQDERTASSQFVSPEMTGAEALDRYGRWDRHPEYGAVWLPLEVSAGWAPYRHGRWVSVRPWGWTWIDEAPWGFAPFHYGRWVHWGGRWGWAPGTYVTRPVYAPALVAWVGGPRAGVSVQIGGGPSVGWLPLSPHDVYAPHYRHSPGYWDRVNTYPRYNRPGDHDRGRDGNRGRGRDGQVPTGPVMYGNQGVPGAVTVVPRDALLQRQPVARAAIDTRDFDGRSPLQPLSPPAGPMVREAALPGAIGPAREQRRDDREPGPRLFQVPGGAAVVGRPAERENTGPVPRFPRTEGAPSPIVDLRRTAPAVTGPQVQMQMQALPQAQAMPQPQAIRIAPPAVPAPAPMAVAPPTAAPPTAAPPAAPAVGPVRSSPVEAPRNRAPDAERSRPEPRGDDERRRIPEQRQGQREREMVR